MHFINVLLPAIDDDFLYEIEVENGEFSSIVRQEGRLFREDFTSIQYTDQSIPDQYQKWDVEGRMMLPGFVDLHMHLDKAFSLAKVPNVSGTLEEAIQNYGAARPSFSYEELKQRMLRAALQSLSFGTTSIRTHIDYDPISLQAANEVKNMLAPFMTIQLVPMFAERHTTKDMEEAIAIGADGLGGAPHIFEHPEVSIGQVFTLAQKHNVFVDLHADENDDPNRRTVLSIAEQTKKYGMEGNVVVGHLCSLSAMTEEDANSVMQTIVDARLGVVTLPGANMYLQGRGDKGKIRRGITRVKELLELGVPVATASDNINDPFHPFGRGDLVQIGLLTGYAAHMGSPSDQRKLVAMITSIPATLFGYTAYGILENQPANFVIMNARSIEDMFVMLPEGRWVYNNKKWVSIAMRTQVFESSMLQELWGKVYN